MNMHTGIYKIEHVASGRVYIGSAKNFVRRWRVHLCLLRKGAHHSKHLQSAWDKHGEAAFVFKELVVCHESMLSFYEAILIAGYRAHERTHGYNATTETGTMLGYKHSDESRDKIRTRRATQVFSEETRAIWRANRTGRKMPAWFGDFVREMKTGTTHSPEARAKISAAHKGKPWSEARRAAFNQSRISDAATGDSK